MKKISFNDSWEFNNIDFDGNIKWDSGKTIFKPVKIPHDYTTECPFDKSNINANYGSYTASAILYYRKLFKLETTSKKTFILFDGVYNNATIYINEKEVYQRSYGYISFCVDVSEHLKEGTNLIVVKVDGSKAPSSRWFNGQGINRNVWIMQADSIYIKNDGVYLKTENIKANSCELIAETTIVSEYECDATLNLEVLDKSNTIIAKKSFSQKLSKGENIVDTNILLNNIKKWDTTNPNLYNCKISIANDESFDCTELKFGVRKLEWIPNQGFFINSIPTKFKGVCMHHDGGVVGSAVPKSLWKKRILMLKEMGCNAIRTSHNPFNPEFYDSCDELGMMVMDEAFDGWDVPKAKFDYGTIWEDNYKKDLSDFIIRDRNHTSIVIWSIGNEILQMNPETTKELMSIVKSYDSTRKVTCGINGVGAVPDANRAVLDIAGYNDGGGSCFVYEEDHIKRPDQLMIATEAPHSFQTRGFYRTQTWWRDKNQPRIEIENLTKDEVFFDQNINYNSSYDNSGVRTCARDSWAISEKLPYLCGEFRWTGFDYVGEAFTFTWPTRTHSFGVIDLANFPKDHYYLYQSMWTDKKMLHILPHWTHNYIETGTLIPVWVYTNCQEVELFLNKKSLGRKKLGDLKNLEWLVPYQEGEILAIAYENNKEILSQKHQTAKTSNYIDLEQELLTEENYNMSQISVKACDSNDIFVPNSNNATAIYVSDNCELMGSENGAIDDMTFWKSTTRKLFSGLGMYLVEFTNKTAFATVVAILGDNYFDNATTINIDLKQANLVGNVENDYQVFYTTDGTPADENSLKYEKSFEINETTCIKTSVYLANKKIIELSDIFIKGRPEPVIDLNHLNYSVNTERPTGPFSEKLLGEWIANDMLYIFEENGDLKRKFGSQMELVGYWWYDFPLDFLETPDYAGMGEIRFATGETAKINLENQTAQKIIMDNSSNAVGTAYGGAKQIFFDKVN